MDPSSPAVKVFSRTGTIAGFVSRAGMQRQLGIKRLGILFSHFESTLLHKSILRLHLFCTSLQSFFYENVPPGLNSLCITERSI